MKLTVLGSSSAGNCYLLESLQGEILIIEAGISFKKVKQAIGFQTSKIVGCLLTHEHGDHAKELPAVLSHGIPVYSREETFNALGVIDNPFQRNVLLYQCYKIGEYSITSFDVKHDAVAPIGFLISHPDCGTILFITDTYFVEWTFGEINHFMIESNYRHDLIKDPSFLEDRIYKSHLSIGNAIEIIKANATPYISTVTLLHLSSRNSNEREFKQAVERGFGVITGIAKEGYSLELNSNCLTF